MSDPSNFSSAYELHGEGLRVVYRPGERLELETPEGCRTYDAAQLVVEPVALGHLVGVQDEVAGAQRRFALLIPVGSEVGDEVSALALVTRPGGAGWGHVTLRGSAARAAREAAATLTEPRAARGGELRRATARAAALIGAVAGATSLNDVIGMLQDTEPRRPDPVDEDEPMAGDDDDADDSFAGNINIVDLSALPAFPMPDDDPDIVDFPGSSPGDDMDVV